MSTSNKENVNENSKELIDSLMKGTTNENVNIKGSPYRKKLASKHLDQIEVTQKLLNDFGMILDLLLYFKFTFIFFL